MFRKIRKFIVAILIVLVRAVAKAILTKSLRKRRRPAREVLLGSAA